MADRTSFLFDQLTPKVLFSGEQVVRATPQGDIACQVLATPSKRPQMVKLEAARFTTALPG